MSPEAAAAARLQSEGRPGGARPLPRARRWPVHSWLPWFRPNVHEDTGTRQRYNGLRSARSKVSRAPSRPPRRRGWARQHSRAILAGELGLSSQEIDELMARGVTGEVLAKVEEAHFAVDRMRSRGDGLPAHRGRARRGRIAIIRLNRPRYRNAQSRLMLEEMTDAFARLDLDNDIRVIVLRGRRGRPLLRRPRLGHAGVEAVDRDSLPFGPGVLGHACAQRILASLHRELAALAGTSRSRPSPRCRATACFGGFLIASCMDLIIAADDAKFLPLATCSCTPTRALGPGRAQRQRRSCSRTASSPLREAQTLEASSPRSCRAPTWKRR